MQKKPSLVLFLGAGFSKGLWDNIPLSSGLTKAILHELEQHPHHRRDLESLILRLFPDLKDPAQVDFETFLGLLDGLCKDRDLAARLDIPDPDRQWDTVVSGLGRAVHRSKRYSKYLAYPPLESLIRILQALEQRYAVSVITTNYDLIADTACFYVNDAPHGKEDVRLNLDRYRYGIHIRGLCQIQSQSVTGGGAVDRSRFVGTPPPRPAAGGISVYKLHGSLNWAFCETCHEIDLAFSKSELQSIYGWRPVPCAADCGGTYKRLIVPPQPSKVYSNYELVKVWKRAETVLSAAAFAVFIGFSLNPIDAPVIQMILRARAISKRSGGGAWAYGLVNPDASLPARYRSLLGEPAIQVVQPFSPASFESRILPRLLSR